MIRLLFCVCFLWVTVVGHAQRFNTLKDDGPFIDSIKTVVQKAGNDSIKAMSCFRLADLFRRNGEESNYRAYLKKGKVYAAGNPFLRDAFQYYDAQNYLLKRDIPNYKKNIESALQKIRKYKTKESYELQVVILQNLSIINRIEDNEKESLRILLEDATPIAKKSENKELMGEIKKHIGIAWMNNSERDKAYDYFKEAINDLVHASKKSAIFKESLIELYTIAAENCAYMNKTREAKLYLNKAFSILKDYPTSNLNDLYYFSEGLCFFVQKNYQEATRSYEKGIQISILNNDLQSLNRLRFVKYQVLFELKKYSEANDLLIDLVEHGNLLAGDRKNYYKEIAATYEKLKDYQKAYLYSQKYMHLNDSLVDSETKKEIIKLETKFNNAEKTKKILSLEKERNEASLKAKNNRLYYFTFALLSFILLLIIFFLRKHLKNQKLIAYQKEENYVQNLEVLQKIKELEIMQAVIDGEESERKRIARDLHDGLGSRLTSLKMLFHHLTHKEINFPEFEKINSELSASITDLRQTAFNLMPETLLKFGLELAIKDLCTSMATEKVNISFAAYEIDKNMRKSNQITIFRIIQELLSNALKHSNCTDIYLECSQNSSLFLISIEDNGIGFKTSESESFTGLGLKNIQNRIEMLNGKYEVNSSDSGTIFNIELNIVNDSLGI